MRWYRELTTTQQRILLALALGLVAVLSLLGWSVWSTLRAAPAQLPFLTPLAADTSPLQTPTGPVTMTSATGAAADPATSLNATVRPQVTSTPVFDISQAGLVADAVAEARESATRRRTALTLVDDTGMAQALYAHYERVAPVALSNPAALQALALWDRGLPRRDVVAQSRITAAFYAPEAEELYLRRDWDGSLEVLETQLAYGYARPLADQYGDLVTLIADAPSLDQRLALTAVAQGDAFVSTLLYRGISPGSLRAGDVYEAVAATVCARWQVEDEFLDELSCLSMRLGTDFAASLYQAGGLTALDEMILRPPRTTEQVLDQASYDAFERPVALEPLDAGLGRGWTLTTSETLGQALLVAVLREWTNGLLADDVGTNWGGDLLQVWQGPDQGQLTVWQVAWDDAEAAVRFYAALLDVMPRALVRGLISDTTPAADLPRGRWWSGGQGTVFLYRQGRRVWLMSGSEVGAVESAARGIP